jgi:hypothetical protein
MLTYRPGPCPRVPGNLPPEMRSFAQQLLEYVERELRSIQKAANASNDYVRGTYLSIAPDKPQDGDYLADGTGWDPGSGRGKYRYDSSTGNFTFLG